MTDNRAPTKAEVDRLYSELIEPADEDGISKYAGMTYEDGVKAVLEMLNDAMTMTIDDVV